MALNSMHVSKNISDASNVTTWKPNVKYLSIIHKSTVFNSLIASQIKNVIILLQAEPA